MDILIHDFFDRDHKIVLQNWWTVSEVGNVEVAGLKAIAGTAPGSTPYWGGGMLGYPAEVTVKWGCCCWIDKLWGWSCTRAIGGPVGGVGGICSWGSAPVWESDVGTPPGPPVSFPFILKFQPHLISSFLQLQFFKSVNKQCSQLCFLNSLIWYYLGTFFISDQKHISKFTHFSISESKVGNTGNNALSRNRNSLVNKDAQIFFFTKKKVATVVTITTEVPCLRTGIESAECGCGLSPALASRSNFQACALSSNLQQGHYFWWRLLRHRGWQHALKVQSLWKRQRNLVF